MKFMVLGSAIILAVTGAGTARSVPLCAFDFTRNEYVGTASDQAKCLLPEFRGKENRRAAATPRTRPLPPSIGEWVGREVKLDPTKLVSILNEANLNAFGAGLSPATNASNPEVRPRYFVIHDTSYPFGFRPIPPDGQRPMNRLGDCWEDKSARAHAFINREGLALNPVDYMSKLKHSATKFEKLHPGTVGVFIHTELVQGRKSGTKNPNDDSVIQVPAFNAKQYKTLALLYIAASARAGRWLVPAYHIAIDEGLKNGHDDPQHFDVSAFAKELEQARARLD